MDFLDIRKKAKERAQARAEEKAARKERGGAENAGAPDRGARPRDVERRRPRGERPRARQSSGPPPDPIVTDQDVIEGALAARLQGLPPPRDAPAAAEPASVPDARFTTWRPGTGAPPVAVPEPGDRRGFDPSGDAQFTVFPPAVAFATTPAPARGGPPFQSPGPTAGPLEPADPLDDFFYRPDEAAPALPHLAPASPLPDEQPVVLAREEYLTFLLGSEEYAVAIEHVHEVLQAPPITEVPRAPGHVLGVVTVRGEVIAVLDPRRRLGLPPSSPGDGQRKVVIVDAGEGSCGLLVDRVASVVRLHPGSIEPCPQGIAGQRSEFLAGIGRDGDRLFTVLDVAALLRRSPARADAPGNARRGDARS